MATSVEFQYGIVFGKCDASDWCEWEETLEGDAEAAYLNCKKMRNPFDISPELAEVLREVMQSVADAEIDNMLEFDDEYTQECTGRYPVDADEVNDLVVARDPHTLEFFNLTEMTDEELDEWDAYDLDELPDVCDFQEDFEPSSPFDGGWILNVEFVEHPEEDDLEEDEATETLTELLTAAHGDYSVVNDYIERCTDLYVDGDLEELAFSIASKLKLTDFVASHKAE